MNIFIISGDDTKECLDIFINQCKFANINVWHESMLLAGSNIINTTIEQYNAADVVLYLISANIFNLEMLHKHSYQLHCNILVNMCLWEYSEELKDNVFLHDINTYYSKSTDKSNFVVSCIKKLQQLYLNNSK